MDEGEKSTSQINTASVHAEQVSSPQQTPGIAGQQQSAAPDDSQPEPHFYHGDGGEPPAPTGQNTLPDSQDLTWTASEYILHTKDAKWYLALAGVSAAMIALIYLLTRDVVSMAMVAVVVLLFAIMAGRPPRQLSYALRAGGIEIGQRFYPYSIFKSFAVVDEGAFSSIAFLPLRRFGQVVSIYYDPKDEDAIVESISKHLPVDIHKLDAVDQLMRRIRF
jgi:hypothetical protein